MPFQRGDRNFLRLWLVAGPFPCSLETDCLIGQGGEAGIQAKDGLEQKRADGTTVKWHSQKSWGDTVAFDDLTGPKDGAVAYAFTKISRAAAGKALLLLGSEDGVRVWLNGKPVLADFDIFVAAGGMNKALVKEFPGIAPDSHGSITVRINAAPASPDQNAKISGIEILAQ